MTDKICPVCEKNKITFTWEDMCYSCQQKKHKQEIKEAIQHGEKYEIFGEDEIYCPWCGEEIYFESDDYRILYEDGVHETECPECGKLFYVETSVSYSYSTGRIEE